MTLTGKNAVFVGGLGYIGYEACKQLMTRKIGSLTVLDCIENQTAVQALQAIDPKCKVYYIKLDITNKVSIKSAIAAIVSKVKYIDVLINGAGITADPNVELTINVNLIGLINMTLEALPYMNKSNHGRGGILLNIASVLGLEPCAPIALYTASKFGVMGFTRSLADGHYYNVTGVAVITFCPGVTDTPLKDNVLKNYTFDYSKELTLDICNAASQEPSICGEHLVQALETQKNGGIFISDLGTLKSVEPKVYWQPQYLEKL